ncbi:MAG: twin-arginine translocase subunit TatC, partial [Planctomycetota bacterium]|nr:twin-arginine translocase subunit TatC [Planctomycetota bacterium]
LFSSLVLFISGVLFSYFIFLPVMLKFLANYGDPSLISNKFNLSYYSDLFILLTLIMGVVFQLPLVMLFLVQIKICTSKTYTNNLRISILLAFIIGAIITPGGDPVSQIMLAIPLLLLYLIGIVLSLIYHKVGATKVL